MWTIDDFNRHSIGRLPAHLGIVISHVGDGELHGEFEVQPHLMAPNGFLHAGSVVTLADTCAGYGCLASLPPGATSFTTLELKSNHLGTAREGKVVCRASALHLGRTTQVWDAVVSHPASGKTLAMFRCTQLLLYAKPAGA